MRCGGAFGKAGSRQVLEAVPLLCCVWSAGLLVARYCKAVHLLCCIWPAHLWVARYAHQTVHHPHIAIVQGQVAGDGMLVTLQSEQRRAVPCIDVRAVSMGMLTCTAAFEPGCSRADDLCHAEIIKQSGHTPEELTARPAAPAEGTQGGCLAQQQPLIQTDEGSYFSPLK